MPNPHRTSTRRRRSRDVSRTPKLRLIALTCVGCTLLSAAYQSAFARSGNPVGLAQGYGEGQGDDDDDGLSTGETLAIAAGATVAVGAGLYFAGVFDDDDEGRGSAATFPLGAPIPAGERLPELTHSREPLARLRLVPGISSLPAGYGVRFHLEAQSARTGKWFSVTGQPGAEIVVKNETPLMKVDGARGTFGLPITAARSADGQKVEVVGTYAPTGQKPLSAAAELQLAVPGI